MGKEKGPGQMPKPSIVFTNPSHTANRPPGSVRLNRITEHGLATFHTPSGANLHYEQALQPGV